MIRNNESLIDRQEIGSDAPFTGITAAILPKASHHISLWTLSLPLTSLLLMVLRNSTSVPQSVYLYAGEFGPVYIAVVGSTSNLNNCRGHLSSLLALAGSAKYPTDQGGTTDIA